MSSKLKKAILAVVIVLIVAGGGLVAFSMLSKVTSTTVYDLRLVDYETKSEIFQKEVYLTAEENNKFDIGLNASASAITNFVVASSDSSVATISKNENCYTVSYFKAGQTEIMVYAPDNAEVNDSFTLTVKEYYPISFNVSDCENPNEVSIYADDKDYVFDFLAKSIGENVPVNNEALYVLNDYNKEIFDSIEIDAENSKLVIKAKQSMESTQEYITVVCKTTDEKTGRKIINNYSVKINVFGNYISDMQLLLSSRPNFDSSIYVCGTGALKENEVRVSQDKLIFCKDVNIVYVKVRIVFTNGEYLDVTNPVNAVEDGTIGLTEFTKPYPGKNYYQIEIKKTAGIKFQYDHAYPRGGQDSISNIFIFKFYDKPGDGSSGIEYTDFIQNQVYSKTTKEDGSVVYFYVHWDERYKREDVITKNGEIIGFKNEPPTCEESNV